MNKINYQRKLEETIGQIVARNEVPKLLLHSCCAPCSSYCLNYLAEFFEITVFYYNPNIAPEEEYQNRVKEQIRLIHEMPARHPVSFAEGKYDTGRFYEMASGLEEEPEGGIRCGGCYRLRQREAAAYAKENGFDYFTTTLSVSPRKDAQKLNEIGLQLAAEYQIPYLVSDFKKKDGYLKSIQLSKKYHLYRQNYCGCVFSKTEAEGRH